MAKRIAATARNMVSKRPYKGFSIAAVLPRPGSADFLKLPSRVGQTRFYPDGTVLKDKE